MNMGWQDRQTDGKNHILVFPNNIRDVKGVCVLVLLVDW